MSRKSAVLVRFSYGNELGTILGLAEPCWAVGVYEKKEKRTVLRAPSK